MPGLSLLLLALLALPLPGAAAPLAGDTPPDAAAPAVTASAVLVNTAAEQVAVDTPQPVEALASPAAAERPGVPIRLRAGTLDLTRGLLPDVPAGLRIDAYPNGERGYYIVQFIGPVQEGWKANVARAGGVLFDYLPDFAFVVAMDDAARNAVAGMKEVAAIGIFQPAYKLSPDLIGVTGVQELVVQTFPGERRDTVRGQAITLGAQVRESTASESSGLLRLSLDAARLADLARIPAVSWIEPFYERVLHNDVARGNAIMAAETAWTNLGLYGAGQIVAVADTGLDTGNTGSLHQDFLGGPTGCSGTGRIIATYALGRTGNWSDSCQTGGANDGGHGTHVSGSVLGNGCRSGSSGLPSGYASSYAGLAPQAGLVMQSVMDSSCGLGGLPADLNTLFNQARDAGARIHTNSWGSAVAGQYTTDSRNSDLFLWNNKYQTILFSAGNEGIDTPSSDGYINPDSIGAPATAKNVITVGASENVRSTGGYNPGGDCSTWGGCWSADYPAEPVKSDRLSDNASGMAAFSSRGPTDDGRIKPDVVAPGSNILSTKSQGAYVSGGWGAGPNQYYQYMGGTSMSTPLTAGAMALIRQFYTDVKSITPSGALLKATVINSAVNLSPGQYAAPLEQQPPLPNNAQGWGRVNVANATDDSHRWQDISDANGLATGGSRSYTYPYCGTAPLKATLVWTDYPGATTAAGALVNDLDLKLTAPDGTTVYLGNVFTNGWSATGGSADRKNPVESVYIQTPAVGNWTVAVTGYNVPNGVSGKQGYALVVDGANTPCAEFTVNATPASQAVCTSNDALYTVAVSEAGTFGSPVTLNASFNPAGPAAAFAPNPVTPSGNATLTVSGAAAGTYNITVTGTSGALSRAGNVTLNVAASLAAAPALTAPANLSTNVARTPTFTWNTVTGAAGYDIQVATDAAFNNLVINQTGLPGASYTPGSALAANTTYYWRVRAANACGAGAYSASYTFVTTNAEATCAGAGGNWNATATWSTGALPTAADHVIIGNGCTVTINTNATIDRLTVGGGTTGVLLFDNTATARTLTVNTSVTIASGGTFRVTQTGSTTQTGHQLSVGTDLTNNGTLDFHHVATGTKGAQITFTGAADASFTLGNGSTTDLRRTTGVTLNKGASSTPVLTFTPGGTFTVQGANTAGFLAISNGTFKIGGTNSFSNPAFNVAAYTIPATGAFWLDNPNATVAGLTGSPTNNGTLRISQGTYNIGTASGNSMDAGVNANYVIEGGILNVAGRLNTGNAANYTQSGGAVNVATAGNASNNNASFGLGNNSVTTISGGVINLVRASTAATPLDYSVYGTADITGGTLNVGTSATTTNFTFRLVGQAPGVTLNNTTNNKNATAVGQLNIWGALTVNTGTTLDAHGFTVLLFGPGVTNNGAIVGTTANSRFDFVGSAAQTYGGAGAFGTAAAPFLSVGIANGSGVTLNAAIVTNRVNLFEGTFANSNWFTLGNGGTSYSTVQIGQADATTPGGNFDASPTFNTGTGGHNILYAQETAARTTGPEIPPSRTAYSVSVDNTNGVTLAGGDLTIANTSAQTSSQLLLTNGRFTLGANNLISVNNAIAGSPFSASKMIVADGAGALCKRYSANGDYLFPIGDASGPDNTPEYSPATLNFTAGSYGSGAQACVNLTNAVHPRLPNTDHILRYWTLTQSGISDFTCQSTFTYTDADILGSEASLCGVKWDASWTLFTPVDQANNQFTANVTSFSAFTASNPADLAVTLAGFTADATPDGVTLLWETVSETDNAGFNVYRADGARSETGPSSGSVGPTGVLREDRPQQEEGARSETGPSGEWTRLNAALIPAAAPGSSEGHAYTWTDATARPNTPYRYRLEAVALDGATEVVDVIDVTYHPLQRHWLPLLAHAR